MSAAPGVHARATCCLQIPAVCAVFVLSQTRACPRFPPRNLNGKEGVSGSSPEEGSESHKIPAKAGIFVVQTETIKHLLRKEGVDGRGPPKRLVGDRSWGHVRLCLDAVVISLHDAARR